MPKKTHRRLHGLYISVRHLLLQVFEAYWVVPPVLIGGHFPVNCWKFFRHWFVAVTFVKYEGSVKNSNLAVC